MSRTFQPSEINFTTPPKAGSITASRHGQAFVCLGHETYANKHGVARCKVFWRGECPSCKNAFEQVTGLVGYQFRRRCKSCAKIHAWKPANAEAAAAVKRGGRAGGKISAARNKARLLGAVMPGSVRGALLSLKIGESAWFEGKTLGSVNTMAYGVRKEMRDFGLSYRCKSEPGGVRVFCEALDRG